MNVKLIILLLHLQLLKEQVVVINNQLSENYLKLYQPSKLKGIMKIKKNHLIKIIIILIKKLRNKYYKQLNLRIKNKVKEMFALLI